MPNINSVQIRRKTQIKVSKQKTHKHNLKCAYFLGTVHGGGAWIVAGGKKNAMAKIAENVCKLLTTNFVFAI